MITWGLGTVTARDAGHGTEGLEVKPEIKFCLQFSVATRKILANGTESRRTDGKGER